MFQGRVILTYQHARKQKHKKNTDLYKRKNGKKKHAARFLTKKTRATFPGCFFISGPDFSPQHELLFLLPKTTNNTAFSLAEL